MKSFIFIAALIFLPTLVLAESYDLSHFHKRFEIKLNDKNEKIIVDKSLTADLNIGIYIKNLATYLSAADAEPVETVPSCKGFDYEKPDPQLIMSFEKAFDWMRKTDLGKLLVNEKFIKFVNAVDLETKKVINDPQFVVVANVDSPNYFYKKAFIKYLSGKLEDLAKSYFNSTIFLKPVTYIADDYANFIVHKKLYHQNILSFYLETIPPSELGLTDLEAKRAMSSIIDSRLSFFGGFLESKKLKNNFDGHGYKRLMEADKAGEVRWTKHAKVFDERLYKINSHFSLASFKSNPVAINLVNKKTKTDDRPSLAYDDSCPDFLYQNRRIFELTRVALGMSPIPYSNKLFALVKSKYQPQSLSEGMLYGYFEATNQVAAKTDVMKQSMNPLLK